MNSSTLRRLLSTALLLGFSTAASGVVTPVLFLRMGEDDAQIVPGPVASLRDSVGSVQTIVSGNPRFSAAVGNVPHIAAASSSCLDFLAGGRFVKTKGFTYPLVNAAVELWVQPSTTTGTAGIVSAGSWGLVQANGEYRAQIGGESFGSAPATPGRWTHLALVNDQGVTTLYADGVACGSSMAAIPVDAGNELGIGALGFSGETGFFRGCMDELRFSLHEPGQFGPLQDLLRTASQLVVGLGNFDGPELVTGTTVDMGLAVAGGSVQKTFYVTNLGSSPMTGLSVTMQGMDSSQFQLISPLTFDTLMPRASTRFIVAFKPSLDGPRTAVMHVTAAAAARPVCDVVLTGRTPTPSLSVISNGQALQQGQLYQIPLSIYDDQLPPAPQPPQPLSDLSSLAIGFRHYLGLRSDGTVTAWGQNFYGQCNVPAGLRDVVQVAAGNGHSLALKRDGTVVGWGSNLAGETTFPAGLSGVTAIAACGSFSAALKSDGTVVTTSGFFNNSPQFAAETNVAAISLSDASILLLKRDGTVTGYGRDANGSLTDLAGKQDIKAIAASIYGTVLVKNDGTVIPTGGRPPAWASLSHVAAAAINSTWDYFLHDDGSLQGIGWKLNQFYSPGGPARSVAAGHSYGAAVYDPALTFPGRTPAGSSNNIQVIEMANTGALPLHLGQITLGGPNAQEFSLDTRGVDTVVDALTGRTRFIVSFHPADSGPRPRPDLAGLRQAWVDIASDDPLHPVFRVPLAATADDLLPQVSVFTGDTTAPEAMISPDKQLTLPPAAPLSGTLSSQIYTLRNDSDTTLTGLSVAALAASENANDDASYFKIVQPTSGSLAPGASTTFAVRFLPAAVRVDPAGPRRALIAVRSSGQELLRMTASVRLVDSLRNWLNTRLNPSDQTETADPNGNGIPNLLEYALNGDPIAAYDPAGILPTVGMGDVPERPRLTLSFAHHADRTGVTLSVMATKDLVAGPWVELARSMDGAPFEGLVPQVTVQQSPYGPVEGVEVSVPPSAAGEQPYRFIRLQATGDL